MKWKKQGLIFEPPGDCRWIASYAMAPIAYHISGDSYRIYFSGRDSLNRAQPGYIEVNIKTPQDILAWSKEPILKIGKLGTFDDSGVIGTCIVDYDGVQYMYYNGWTQAKTVPFFISIGLAMSKDGGKTFKRFSEAPVLGRNHHDPYLTASAWVIKEHGIWRMWYVSGTGWEIEPNSSKPKHYYHIRYAESDDGIHWQPEGVVCIDYKKDEYAIARPVVYKEDGIYKMWYCHRGGTGSYRAGYAESRDGLVWERKDNEVDIDVSRSGWDSEMICYPCVFEHQGKKYMLYNGNGYGKTGVGLAVLDT